MAHIEAKEPLLVYPRELTRPVRDVLHLMLNNGPTMRLMRRLGAPLPKSLDDRIVVLHWLLALALEHGDNWRQVAVMAMHEMTGQPSAMPPEDAAVAGAGPHSFWPAEFLDELAALCGDKTPATSRPQNPASVDRDYYGRSETPDSPSPAELPGADRGEDRRIPPPDSASLPGGAP